MPVFRFHYTLLFLFYIYTLLRWNVNTLALWAYDTNPINKIKRILMVLFFLKDKDKFPRKREKPIRESTKPISFLFRLVETRSTPHREIHRSLLRYWWFSRELYYHKKPAFLILTLPLGLRKCTCSCFNFVQKRRGPCWKFWTDSSDRLMYEGKAPELSDTRAARMPAFFEHSNVNLPQYAWNITDA